MQCTRDNTNENYNQHYSIKTRRKLLKTKRKTSTVMNIKNYITKQQKKMNKNEWQPRDL